MNRQLGVDNVIILLALFFYAHKNKGLAGFANPLL